jgi:hypothetical protein
LWEISARVKEQIEAQMTPAQKEYWAAQGGYFEQVMIMMTLLDGYCIEWSAAAAAAAAATACLVPLGQVNNMSGHLCKLSGEG